MDYLDSTKQCSVCFESKPLSAFYPKQRRCKQCKLAAELLLRQSASPEKREKQRLWRKEYKRAQRRANGIPTVQERALLRWRNTVWPSIVKRANEYAKQRRAQLTSAERFRIRYRNDAEFRTKQIMRTNMRKTEKRYSWVSSYLATSAKTAGKRDRIWQVLGYTSQELLQHLQRQFTKGMTMDHFMRGEVHIDHIIPKSSFTLDSLEDVRACHALYNLRPMWAKDNIRKSNHVLTLL